MKHTRNIIGAIALIMVVCPVLEARHGPGLATATLVMDKIEQIEVGGAHFWNTGMPLPEYGTEDGNKFLVHVELPEDSPWHIQEGEVYAGRDPVPVKKDGSPHLGRFTQKWESGGYARAHTFVMDLRDDVGFNWGGYRIINVAIHLQLAQYDEYGEMIAQDAAWAYPGPDALLFEGDSPWGWWFTYELAHPRKGQFIDSPVKGLSFQTPTHSGRTGDNGGFAYFPGETIDFQVGSVYLGESPAVKKVSPLDLFPGSETSDPRVVNMARFLQSLDSNGRPNGAITITEPVRACLDSAMDALGYTSIDFGDGVQVEQVIDETIARCPDSEELEISLVKVSADEAQGNLEAGLNASGIFRKNVTKTEDWGETKQKLDVMPVYFPGLRSNGEPSLCIDVDEDGIYDEGVDTLGIPYEEWRLGGDPYAEECDPRDYEDPMACTLTLIECRDVGKPVLVTYMAKIDLSEAKIDFDECGDPLTEGCRFSHDIFTAVSRDDGTTWKRMNVSRMADLSSFDLETEEPFPGTCGSPYMKINDNYVLIVWQSKFCKSGNPRYAIDNCTLYPDDCVDDDGDTVRDEVCRGNPANGTEVCEDDYPADDAYYVTDIWGVRGQQQSVNYDEVDDVAELGIGEIPYSCIWAARGVIVSQRELDAGTFASLTDDKNLDCTDLGVPYECCTGAGTGTCEVNSVELGDIVWYKPERLTSGRRDAYIPVAASARGAGFAIAWQEDPEGLRPGKGKGPGQGWSGAISNHKTDIWYSYLKYDDFAVVDEAFVPGGPPESEGPDEKPGVGRPKALVPFSLPVRISDNDMVNTHTLKVEQSINCVVPPDGTEQVCFPEVVDGTFVPLDPEEIASQFCDHPDANPDTCCDPDNHEGDPNCEDLKGLYGNMTGTKRYAYLANTIDNDGDTVPDYQYYVERGGTLDLCDTTGGNSYMDSLPGTSAHERWYGFTNVAGSSKLVCVTSDGRLLDGDISASRPNMQMQPYTKPDGTKSGWILLGYEESKGMGHSLAAEAHEDDGGDDIIGGGRPEDPGQDKPIKQDLGKNVIYHTFDFTQPDLVSPGHIVNLPALCGGLYPTWCGEDYLGDNPTCTCELGQPVPLYFDYYIDNGDGTGEWMPDETKFLQYRTEIARRVRFIVQSPGKAKGTTSKTAGAIIYKQGQEGQGRPADVFIRRLELPPLFNPKTMNPYAFDNFECNNYLDETFGTIMPGCPGDGVKGYMCNVWGEAYGDRLCGGFYQDPSSGYPRRDHVNLTSADIDLAVDAGPDDDTPEDPTDDVYGTDKVLLWTQHDYNLWQESYGVADTSVCDLGGCAGMYSNARSHRGFIRGDFFVTAYAMSPNWAAARNGRDRYNFYIRKSFDGGQTWTTVPAGLGGEGVYYCREWRTDPDTKEAPVYDGFDPDCSPCVARDESGNCIPTLSAELIPAGFFEPAVNMSQIRNNKETSSDPRVGATPPTYPLDARDGSMPILRFVEDEYVDNVFFVAWGTGDNLKSTGGTTVTPEAPPLDVYYTRSEDYGDTFLKIPWNVNPLGNSDNWEPGEEVWRYDFLAHGEEEQGECQLRATPDGSKMYGIWHQLTPVEGDPDEPITRWYPWEPEQSTLNDIWFRRVIFWPELAQ